MKGLDGFRKEIDKINSKIVELLAKRKEVVKKVGKYKKEHNLDVTDSKREDVVFEKVGKLAEEKGVNKTFAKELFSLIIKQAKREQE